MDGEENGRKNREREREGEGGGMKQGWMRDGVRECEVDRREVKGDKKQREKKGDVKR